VAWSLSRPPPETCGGPNVGYLAGRRDGPPEPHRSRSLPIGQEARPARQRRSGTGLRGYHQRLTQFLAMQGARASASRIAIYGGFSLVALSPRILLPIPRFTSILDVDSQLPLESVIS